MRKAELLLKRSRWIVPVVILVGVAIGTVASQGTSQDQPRQIKITVKNIAERFSVLDLKHQRSRVQITLRNDYSKPITAFAIGKGDSHIKVDIAGTGEVIAPGSTRVEEVTLPPAIVTANRPDSREYVLSILAVVFDDETGDGNTDVVKEILNSRRKGKQEKSVTYSDPDDYRAVFKINDDEASVIVRGQMTPMQREHSKLYLLYYGNRQKLVEDRAIEDRTVFSPPPLPILSPSGEPPAPPFASLACEADAVVVATVRSKASQLTEEEAFIFTDYEMTVEEILKNNPASPITLQGSIMVTRPSGAVEIEGHKIKVVESLFAPLKGGHRYLLFLDFNHSLGTYRAFRSKGSFEIRGNRIIKLTMEYLPQEIENGADPNSVLNEAKASIAACK